MLHASPISLPAALIALVLATVILAQGITAPYVKDAEPQSSSWIQDIVSGNHFLVARDLYGELNRKPPLYYWLSAAIAAADGGHVDEVNGQIVSVLSGALVALMVLIWTGSLLGSTTGWLAFLFLLGSYGFSSRGTLALTDMALLAAMFWAWCLLYAQFEQGVSNRRTAVLGIAMGLGILSKGPIAVVLTAFAATLYLRMTRRSIIEQLRQRWPWIALVVALAIALPWYIAAIASEHKILTIVSQENAGHFLPIWLGGTGEAARPIYFIAAKLLGGLTPLNFILPALIVALVHGGFAEKARKPVLFQLSFVLATLILFSLASSKRDDYILPAMPGLAIMLAAMFTIRLESGIARGLRDVGVAAVALVAIGALIASAVWISLRPRASLTVLSPMARAEAHLLITFYVAALSLAFVATALVVVACAALMIQGLIRQRPTHTGLGLGLMSLIGVLIFIGLIRPALAMDRTLKYVASDIDHFAPDGRIYVATANQELSYYLGRQAPVIVGPHQTLRKVNLPAYLFAYPGDLNGPAGTLRDRLKLVREWRRAGREGSPALYEIEPEGLKPPLAQDK